MKISYTVAYLSVITGLGICMQSEGWTWFKAQDQCRNLTQTLPLSKNEANKFYWTGFYKRISHWIKILGCYNESAVSGSKEFVFNLSSSSPGFCQETCMGKDFYLFAVQGKTCVCLSSDFNISQNQLPPLICNYTCNNSMLLSKECGGESAYNVFLTDLSNLHITSRCLSIACAGIIDFTDIPCNQYLHSICNTSNSKSWPWREGMDHCKKMGIYLFGNVNLSNKTLACTDLNNNDQRWIGVVKDQYIKADQGQLIEESDRKFFISCLKCQMKGKTLNCTFESCSTELNSLICTESAFIVTQIPDTTEHSTSIMPQLTSTVDITKQTEIQTVTQIPITTEREHSTKSQNASDMYTTKKTATHKSSTESSVTAVVVPLVLVIVIAFCIAVFVIHIRRKRHSKDQNKNGVNKPRPKNPECYSEPANNKETNYFVLQQNNPSYELADDIQIGPIAESPYNEAEDGTYDHLGDKDARKQPDVDDTYNHASVVMSPDLSDYDVANHKQVLEEDNTYDHTSPTENSYGHFNTSPTQEPDYSDHELF
ncbi:uncharacterized protein LOC111105805 [Crassostrea virginica]